MGILYMISILSVGGKLGSLGWGLSFRYIHDTGVYGEVTGIWIGNSYRNYVSSEARLGYFLRNDTISPYMCVGFGYESITYSEWYIEDEHRYSFGMVLGVSFNPFYGYRWRNFLTLEPEAILQFNIDGKGEFEFNFSEFGFSIFYNFGGL